MGGSNEKETIYDCIVVGAGAAGMASSIYLSRYRLNHLVFGEVPGGQFLDASVVENYPGSISISGTDLVTAFKKHVESYGVQIRQERIGEIKPEEKNFIAKNTRGDLYRARTVILALGARHRPLNVPGEDKFLSKGVSYCAICDAPLFKGKDVAVVGGGDSAVTAAIHAASFARKVYVIVRRGEYRAEPIWVEKMHALPNVEEVLNNTVQEIQGKSLMEKIVLSSEYKGKKELSVSGVFVEIGLIPATALAVPLGVKLDENGYITVDARMETNISGVFAAGDLALVPGSIPFRQIVTSAGQGAMAAAAAHQYLRRQAPPPNWG